MNSFNLLQHKRECFHLEIRKNHLEKVFSLKRKPQNPNYQLSQHYQMIMQQYGQIKLIDLLYQINFQCKQHVQEMLQNDLAAQVVKLLVPQELYESWELFKQLLQYLILVFKLPDEVLVPYLIQHQMFKNLTEFYFFVIQELFRKGKYVVGDTFQNPLEKGETDQIKLSYTFILLDQILFNVAQDREARKQMLKSKQFIQAVCQVFHIQMDDQVLDLHLQFTSSLLQDLYKQDNDCIRHAAVFIRPICGALQCRNIQKLNYILQMLLNLTFVGMQNGYINTFFRHGGCIELMKILEECLNDQLCLRITAEIASQSPSHIEILFKNKLLELLKPKLASNSNQVQYSALWVVEYCLGGAKQFYDTLFQHVDITNQVMNLLQSEDESVSVQACFTICAYFQKANNQQIQQLCFSRIHIKIIQFLKIENEQLRNGILESIIAILNLEAWQGNHCHYISNSEREDIRFILENIDSDLVNSVLSYL